MKLEKNNPMKAKKLTKFLKTCYFTLFFGYILFLLFSFGMILLESFTYSGFFIKHFGLSPNIFIASTIVLAFLISVISPDKLVKKDKWLLIMKKALIVNVKVFFCISLMALLLNFLEYATYSNFVYSKIHLQPRLLYKAVFLEMISLYVNVSLVIGASGGGDNFLLIRGFKRTYKLLVSNINYLILLIYSVILLLFVVTNSFTFIKKFYQPDKAFLKENELKYYRKQMDIFEWVEEFFPQTKDLITWCNQQSEPVKLVTFDPQIIWMNYEGMTRVFLTNCYYDNIYSVNKTYSYIGESNLFLVSTASCNIDTRNYRGDPKSDKFEYLKDVNNYYVCRSKEIIPGLYKY